MVPAVNSLTFSFSFFVVGLKAVQRRKQRVGMRHLLANDCKHAKNKCIDIISKHSINDAGPIEPRQLSLGFCRCLWYPMLSLNHTTTKEGKVSYPVYRKSEQLDHLDEGTFDPVRG
jgi:hypothetical protein